MAVACGKFYNRDEVLNQVVREGESCEAQNSHGRDGKQKKATRPEEILASSSFNYSRPAIYSKERLGYGLPR